MIFKKRISKIESQRQKFWYEQNKLSEENLNHIKNVIIKPHKKIINVKECIDCGETALLFEYHMRVYKVEVIKEGSCLILSKRKQSVSANIANYNSKDKECYSIIDHAGKDGCFYGNDAWYDVIHWVVRKEIKNGIAV